MSDTIDTFKLFHEELARRQLSKLEQREKALDRLEAEGIEYVTGNNGIHIRIITETKAFDFWPGPGKWAIRGEKQYRYGLEKLILTVKQCPPYTSSAQDM